MSTLSQTPAMEPEELELVLGTRLLKEFAAIYPDRGQLLNAYAQVLVQVYSFPSSSNRCEACDEQQETAAGYLVLLWRAVVRWHWGRILLFSTLMLPVLIVAHAMPVAVIPVLEPKISEEINCATVHPICRRCWRRYRIRQALAGVATFVLGLTMALSFIAGLIVGAFAAACWAGLWGFKPSEAIEPALIALGLLALLVAARVCLTRTNRLILVPRRLRRLGKRPFQVGDGKLVGAGVENIASLVAWV